MRMGTAGAVQITGTVVVVAIIALLLVIFLAPAFLLALIVVLIGAGALFYGITKGAAGTPATIAGVILIIAGALLFLFANASQGLSLAIVQLGGRLQGH